MKKILLLLVIILAILTAHAGYIIRGISTSVLPYNLKNYTLALDNNGEPFAAGTAYTSYSPLIGRNSIVIIPADLSVPPVAFPISSITIPSVNVNIDVKDMGYDATIDSYILCGTRESAGRIAAFIAVVDAGFNTMDYIEYTDANIFYSICIPNNLLLDYYVAGKRGNYGVIASIRRSNLQITNFVTTDNEWECHKIIAKPNNNLLAPRFVVSGRNPECTQVGYSVVNPSFTFRTTYVWQKLSEREALCVVCEHTTVSNQIVLASSYQGTVTLYPVIFSATPSISEYNYIFWGTENIKFCVQDIGMNEINDVFNPIVSVAGFMTPNAITTQHLAWYGKTGLAVLAPMRNKNYSLLGGGQYEHYKIKYDSTGEIYTGGYFEDDTSMATLFGSPNKNAPDCDIDYLSSDPIVSPIDLTTFGLSPRLTIECEPILVPSEQFEISIEVECDELKGSNSPEFAMPSPETESKIITFYDHITVKDIPSNTHYQIYTVLGQLIQTGATAPDISTAQLGRGIYILRLENGKAYKFVK